MPEVAVASLDPRLQRQVETARSAFERGNYDYVLEICATILRQAPACLAVRKLRRAAQLRQHQAKGRLARALGSVSTAPFLLSAGAQTKKDPAKVLETAEKMLASDPTNVAALRLLAQAAAALGWPETAVFGYEAIREQNPTDVENLLALGGALVAAGRATDAVKVAEVALRVQPTNAAAQTLLKNASVAQTVTQGKWETGGTYRAKLKDEARAVSLEHAAKVATSEEMALRLAAEARDRVAREPDNLNHYRSLVQAYRTLGQPEEALAWVRKARQRPAGAGDASLEKIESELRVATLETKSETLEPGAAPAAVLPAARAEVAALKLADAQALVEKYPNDLAARLDLGNLYLAGGQIEPAIAQYQQAQRNPKARVAALVGLGRCFREKKLPDLAVAQFESAKAETGPLDDAKKEILYELAQCLEAMGLAEKAIAEYKAIYAVDIGYRDVAAKINAYYAR